MVSSFIGWSAFIVFCLPLLSSAEKMFCWISVSGVRRISYFSELYHKTSGKTIDTVRHKYVSRTESDPDPSLDLVVWLTVHCHVGYTMYCIIIIFVVVYIVFV